MVLGLGLGTGMCYGDRNGDGDRDVEGNGVGTQPGGGGLGTGSAAGHPCPPHSQHSRPLGTGVCGTSRRWDLGDLGDLGERVRVFPSSPGPEPAGHLPWRAPEIGAAGPHPAAGTGPGPWVGVRGRARGERPRAQFGAVCPGGRPPWGPSPSLPCVLRVGMNRASGTKLPARSCGAGYNSATLPELPGVGADRGRAGCSAQHQFVPWGKSKLVPV